MGRGGSFVLLALGMFCACGSSWLLSCCALTTSTPSPLHPPQPRRYRARVAYDGTSFQGFQIQQGCSTPPRRTVQGDLEEVLLRRLNESIRVVGAGRTDAGVHARGQAIHFDVSCDHRELGSVLDESENDSNAALMQVQRSIEKMLPKDIVFWNLQQAPPPITKTINGEMVEKPWNVIYDSTRKLYSYRLNISPTMNPLERHYRWHPDLVHRWLDEETFCRVLQYYVGTHDFRAFASDVERLEKQLGGPLRTIRTVYNVTVHKENNNGGGNNDGNVRIDFMLKGALYKQVRNMVGTALEVCRGRMEEGFLVQLLHQQTNDNNGQKFVRDDNPAKPAPPQGLTLECVYFDDDDDPF